MIENSETLNQMAYEFENHDIELAMHADAVCQPSDNNITMFLEVCKLMDKARFRNIFYGRATSLAFFIIADSESRVMAQHFHFE